MNFSQESMAKGGSGMNEDISFKLNGETISVNTNAQRSLLSFEETQISSMGNITQSLIKLYKALGGGWNPEEN